MTLVFPTRLGVVAGGLDSYRINPDESYREAATYIAKILKAQHPEVCLWRARARISVLRSSTAELRPTSLQSSPYTRSSSHILACCVLRRFYAALPLYCDS